MAKNTYNPKSAKSILKHGEALLGLSLRQLHPNAVIFGGKGGLGTSVEKVVLMNELPENWTYPLIQPKLIENKENLKLY